MEKCRPDPCVFRMVVDGKVGLIMTVRVNEIVVAGSSETYRGSHAAFNMRFPPSDLGDLTWYTGCAFNHDWKLSARWRLDRRRFRRAC